MSAPDRKFGKAQISQASAAEHDVLLACEEGMEKQGQVVLAWVMYGPPPGGLPHGPQGMAVLMNSKIADADRVEFLNDLKEVVNNMIERLSQ